MADNKPKAQPARIYARLQPGDSDKLCELAYQLHVHTSDLIGQWVHERLADAPQPKVDPNTCPHEWHDLWPETTPYVHAREVRQCVLCGLKQAIYNFRPEA